jgi:hypothetical protein
VRRAGALLPSRRSINYLLALPTFVHRNGRLPRSPRSAGATINDLIFNRMVTNCWSPLQEAVVDKEHAKCIAKGLAPSIQVPETVLVVPLDANVCDSRVRSRLAQFIGRRYVAKPTHKCGEVLFLDEPDAEARLSALVKASRANYFHFNRETQYRRLKPKIIVEPNLSPAGAPPPDYKFLCSEGKVLACQVDLDRFGNHTRQLHTVPDFRLLDIRIGHLGRDLALKPPVSFKEMVEIAGQLSKPFDFVRVDLYDVGGRVYFGELTFTPGAGVENWSNDAIALELAEKVRHHFIDGGADAALDLDDVPVVLGSGPARQRATERV